jgi:alpha-galactosidase
MRADAISVPRRAADGCFSRQRPVLLSSRIKTRYTKRPIYWPHHTLKNLWDLSHLIDPVRLRFEFNNPDTNHDNYSWSPLGHGKYRPDTLFATVMAASPLAWMELSDVSEKS